MNQIRDLVYKRALIAHFAKFHFIGVKYVKELLEIHMKLNNIPASMTRGLGFPPVDLNSVNKFCPCQGFWCTHKSFESVMVLWLKEHKCLS